jgi:hypothetical protein
LSGKLALVTIEHVLRHAERPAEPLDLPVIGAERSVGD